jgi:hypothetical protein
VQGHCENAEHFVFWRIGRQGGPLATMIEYISRILSPTTMTQFTRWLLLAGAGVVAVILLSGCQSAEIGLHYIPQKDVAPVIGADRVPIKISVTDARVVKWVGTADESTADWVRVWHIYATNDVIAVLKNGIADELARRGFKLSDNGVSLVVGLDTIDGESVSIIGTGKFAISVQVVQSDGTISYSKLITGKGRSNPLAHYDDGKIIKLALDRALQNCLSQLFADPSFVKALLNSSG